MDIAHKQFTGSMLTWATWEQEFYSRYLGVLKFGPYITSMLVKLARTSACSMRELQPKVTYVYDSATADRRWMELNVPEDT